jgi:hypothetical protein
MQEAERVRGAVLRVIEAGFRTPDLIGGEGVRVIGTQEMGKRVGEALGA